LSDGTVIDARVGGNAARWINHSCDPNCEALESTRNRVWIYAKRTIRPGEELTYDYRLTLEGPISQRTRKALRCKCRSARCRGTMLMDPAEE
jgi:SET domain-containing protein